jgi:hypothetical protein
VLAQAFQQAGESATVEVMLQVFIIALVLVSQYGTKHKVLAQLSTLSSDSLAVEATFLLFTGALACRVALRRVLFACACFVPQVVCSGATGLVSL